MGHLQKDEVGYKKASGADHERTKRDRVRTGSSREDPETLLCFEKEETTGITMTMSNDLIISQSFMKAVNKGHHPDELEPQDYPKCPMKAYAIYVEDKPSPPTKAMIKGNYFETLVYGGTEDGSMTRMPRKQNQEKTVEERRVELQAMRFKTKLAQERKMNFIRPREHIYVRIMPGVMFRARIDVVTSFLDDDGVFWDEVILDTKITASVHSSFGEYSSWGAPEKMDHIQAVSYSWAYEKKYGKRVPFWYCVMDTSPRTDYKFVGGMVSDMQIAEFREDIRRTLVTIGQYEKTGWPKVPSNDNCRNCPLASSCSSFVVGNKTQRIFQ